MKERKLVKKIFVVNVESAGGGSSNHRFWVKETNPFYEWYKHSKFQAKEVKRLE